MAMRRRRFGSRRPFRRRIFRRGPGFARQKFDKIVLFNNLNLGLLPAGAIAGCEGLNGNSIFGCGPLEVGGCSKRPLPDPFCGPGTSCGECEAEPSACVCCSNQINFTLVNNMTLQSYFQDRVTIVRMYGDVYFRAVVASPFNTEYCSYPGATLRAFNEIFRSAYAEQWHWSMRKHLRTQADTAAAELSPFDAASPAYNFDWTESSPRWLWQRFKMWFPRNQRTFQSMSRDSVYGICSDSEKPATIVPPTVTGSNPGWIDSALTTVCTPFAPNEDGICPVMFTGEQVTEPPWHRMRIRLRKHITMKNDEDLNLICQVRHPAVTTAGGWPCIEDGVFGGFPRGGDVTYQFFVRIAAAVRLN